MVSAFYTDSGKARLIPNEIACSTGTDTHAGSAPSLHGRELSPRAVPFCTFCGHDEPGDLDSRTYLYLERRYVFACADAFMCDERASRLTNDGWSR